MDSLEWLSGTPKVRIVNIYSTNYLYLGTKERPLNEELLLGSLASYYDQYRNQLPRLLPEEFLTEPGVPPQVQFRREVPGIADAVTEVLLFALPSNQVILVVWFGIDCDLDDLAPIVGVLEEGIEGGILIDGESLEETLNTRLAGIREMKPERKAGADSDTPPLLPERHQLVFIRRDTAAEEVPSPDTVRTIVYRRTPPFTEEFARPKVPEQLNQVRPARTGPDAPGNAVKWRQLLRLDEPLRENHESEHRKITLGVVTPYVSLLFGHQPYIEESVLLSSVHAVGTASQFRRIWSETYEQVQLFRRTKQEQEPGRQTRDSLEDLADRLGNLEFDLTFSVEFPQLRVESFQAALYDAMDLSNQAKTLSTMFTQVASSVRSEITAISVREQRRSEGRRHWNAFAAGLLSLAGVSVGLVVAFLGTNTRQVPDNPTLSMWHVQFLGLYLTAGLFALSTTYIIAFPYLRDYLQPTSRKDRRAAWVALALGLAGLTVGLAGSVGGATTGGRAAVVSAVGKGVGGFLLATGISVAAMWLWYRRTFAGSRTGPDDRTGPRSSHGR